MLDLGCGAGHVSYTVAPHARTVVASDLSDAMLQTVRATAGARGIGHIETVRAAAERLPFPDADFDVVVSRFSAHHWTDLDAGLREVRRVLRPSGRLLIVDVSAPADPLSDTFLQTIEMIRDPSHVRDYSVSEWIAASGRARLGVKAIRSERLAIDFLAWIKRMDTPPASADVIRQLQQAMPDSVRQHFAIRPNGDFAFDTLWAEFSAPSY